MRNAGFQRADLLGHAATVFEPECTGERVGRLDRVVLRGDGLVGDSVLRFQPLVNLPGRGLPEADERSKCCQKAETEQAKAEQAQPVRHDPENSQPGKAEIERNNAQKRS